MLAGVVSGHYTGDSGGLIDIVHGADLGIHDNVVLGQVGEVAGNQRLSDGAGDALDGDGSLGAVSLGRGGLGDLAQSVLGDLDGVHLAVVVGVEELDHGADLVVLVTLSLESGQVGVVAGDVQAVVSLGAILSIGIGGLLGAVDIDGDVLIQSQAQVAGLAAGDEVGEGGTVGAGSQSLGNGSHGSAGDQAVGVAVVDDGGTDIAGLGGDLHGGGADLGGAVGSVNSVQNTLHSIQAVVSGGGQAGLILVAADVLLAHVKGVDRLLVGDKQGVEDHLSSVVAGQRIGGLHVQALGQRTDGAGLVGHVAVVLGAAPLGGGLGVTHDVDGPVGVVGVATVSGVIAHGHQQHLGGLDNSHGLLGEEVALAVAGDDAVGVAELDVTLGPAVVNVGQVGLGALEGALIHITHQEHGDQLGHGGAIHGSRGIVGAIRLALDDAQVDHQGDGLLVGDLIGVGKIGEGLVRSAGADDHHAQEHDGGQSQTEDPLEVSHLEIPPSKI